jgi:hypothetical protein
VSQRGQASLEYVAVVALVAGVVVLGATAANAAGIGKAVTAQVARALCVVGGGECDADRLPCPTRWRRDEGGWKVTMSVVRFGKGWFETLEERSDGTFALTRATTKERGLELSSGLRVEVKGKEPLVLSGGAGLAQLASEGRTWVVADRAAAERISAALEHDEPVPEPTESFFDDGAKVSGQFTAGLVRGPVQGGGTADAEWSAVEGVKLDHATGRWTVFRRGDKKLGAKGRGAVTRGKGEVSRSVEGAWRHGRDDLAVTREADGRPVELVLTRMVPGGDLPPEAYGGAAHLPRGTGRRLVVLERRLDLSDPEARRAALAYEADQERHGAALEALLERQGVINVRAYRLDTDKGGTGAEAGSLVLRAGYSRDRASEQALLVGAATRDLAGQWRSRGDCLG